MPEGHKWCPECGEIKALVHFRRHRSQKSGYGSYCKPCHNVITARDTEKHGGARNYHLRRRYGITAEHADRMLVEQNGVCAICREAPAVHHDHVTGRVRGLLCSNCNGALGQFRDRSDLMSRAMVYLGAGAGAVAGLENLDHAVSTGTHETARPDGEDNRYLFDYLDELEAV